MWEAKRRERPPDCLLPASNPLRAAGVREQMAEDNQLAKKNREKETAGKGGAEVKLERTPGSRGLPWASLCTSQGDCALLGLKPPHFHLRLWQQLCAPVPGRRQHLCVASSVFPRAPLGCFLQKGPAGQTTPPPRETRIQAGAFAAQLGVQIPGTRDH